MVTIIWITSQMLQSQLQIAIIFANVLKVKKTKSYN
jgi:hypothetical protein